MQKIPIEEFGKYFNGQSMFHKFVDKTNIIQLLHDKFLDAKASNRLNEISEVLPLTSLCPDQEYRTALFYCVEKENLKAFEMIIEIITDFPDLILTS